MTFNYDHIQYGHYKCNGIRQREVVATPGLIGNPTF